MVGIVEAAMDRGVAQISDLIELAQFFQHLVADRVGRNFAPAGFELVHDVVHRLLKHHEADRTLLARCRDAFSQLAAIENLMGVVSFDDAQIGSLDFLVGGVTESTGETNAAAADAGTIARLS